MKVRNPDKIFTTTKPLLLGKKGIYGGVCLSFRDSLTGTYHFPMKVSTPVAGQRSFMSVLCVYGQSIKDVTPINGLILGETLHKLGRSLCLSFRNRSSLSVK